MKQNCINCGAVLHYEDNKATCEYCGSEYILDQLGRVEQYKVELEILGEKREFYISDLSLNRLYANATRDSLGRVRGEELCTKLKLELIEM